MSTPRARDLALLADRRTRALETYAAAPKYQSGREAKRIRLLDATTALLRAEIAAGAPRHGRRKPINNAAAADLFTPFGAPSP